jgi:hypothetical protein
MVAKIADVVDKSFDYIIIGGGVYPLIYLFQRYANKRSQTAGLTAAARLSEDPSISVAVLEAGSPNLDDPKIIIPAQLTKTFTDPQVFALPKTCSVI